MKTYTTFNGYQTEEKEMYTTVCVPSVHRWNTGTTRVRNCAKSNAQQRMIKELDNTLNEFARVLGNEKARERANDQRNQYKAYRAAKKQAKAL